MNNRKQQQHLKRGILIIHCPVHSLFLLQRHKEEFDPTGDVLLRNESLFQWAIFPYIFLTLFNCTISSTSQKKLLNALSCHANRHLQGHAEVSFTKHVTKQVWTQAWGGLRANSTAPPQLALFRFKDSTWKLRVLLLHRLSLPAAVCFSPDKAKQYNHFSDVFLVLLMIQGAVLSSLVCLFRFWGSEAAEQENICPIMSRNNPAAIHTAVGLQKVNFSSPCLCTPLL